MSGQRDVVFGLLDAMSARGEADLAVRGSGGGSREARLYVPDADERRRLTEPAELFRGLGFQFWTPTVPAVLGEVVPDGPAARAGLHSGDRIVAIDGVPMRDFRQIVDYISARPAARINIAYERGGLTRSAAVQVVSEQSDGHLIGRIRVRPPAIAYPPGMLLHTSLGAARRSAAPAGRPGA